MQATIKDGKLIIEIDLQTPPAPSASGQTMVVASNRVRSPSVIDPGACFWDLTSAGTGITCNCNL